MGDIFNPATNYTIKFANHNLKHHEFVFTHTGKKKWPVKTIENILTNEKYTGTSVYGETESADFPSTKRTVRDPFEVHRSCNHHIPIIHERQFKRVQKLKAKRSNIEIDEHLQEDSPELFDSKKQMHRIQFFQVN